jgi:anti-anti-sigma factor
LIAITGRVDSVEAVHLEEALVAAGRRGKHRLVVDMSRLEYMSSAGFRALANAQRNNRHNKRGEVILTQVPALVREALELVGFTDYFKIIDPPAAAVEYAESSGADVSNTGALPASAGT